MPSADSQSVSGCGRVRSCVIGFPVCWYREASIIDTFLETYDFSGKKIVPFCTSGSSGIGDTAKRMQEIVRNAIVGQITYNGKMY